jgi:hypothetical protein
MMALLLKNTIRMNHRVTFVLLLMISFACNKAPEKASPYVDSNSKNSNSLDRSFQFIDSIKIINTNKPIKLAAYNKGFGHLITYEKYNQLGLESVFGAYQSDQVYRLYFSINTSNEINSLLYTTSDDDTFHSAYLVTYDSVYNMIDHLKVNNYKAKEGTVSSTYLTDNKLYVENYVSGQVTEYVIDPDGRFLETNRPVTFKHYKYLNKNINSVYDMPKLNVKAKNGLIIKDSMDNSVGRLEFGETAYVVEYTKDSILVEDSGQVYSGTKIKIVINKDAVKTGKNFYIDKSNVGYVFSGFLFNHDSFHDEIDQYHYSYDHLALGKNYNEASINLKELFEIKSVDYNDYEPDFTKETEFITSDLPEKKDNKIVLNFENGKQLILKDTTYQSEYSPTKSYNVSYHPDFKDAYLVSESMFFTDEIYSVISKKNGDTLYQFRGYPHISPNRAYSVSVFPDWTECIQQTSLVINRLKNDQYINYVYVAVNSWSYPFKINSEGTPIDDFYIRWLSDNEFIIRVKNPEECDLGELITPFYLKYKIK